MCRGLYRLPRFCEDLEKGNKRRIVGSLLSAEAWVEQEKQRRLNADPLRPHRRRREFLKLCSTGPMTKELITLARTKLGVGERQAYKLLKSHRDAGYITAKNRITAAGWKSLKTQRKLFVFPQST